MIIDNFKVLPGKTLIQDSPGSKEFYLQEISSYMMMNMLLKQAALGLVLCKRL